MRLSNEQREQVITLRRTHSLSEVASLAGLSLGTVKAIVSRSGLFTDNPRHRAMFTLPPIKPNGETLPAVQELPPQQAVTGDREVDALLWLRQVIETGEPARIEQAKQAAGQITTPLDELEKRYGKWLVAGAGQPINTRPPSVMLWQPPQGKGTPGPPHARRVGRGAGFHHIRAALGRGCCVMSRWLTLPGGGWAVDSGSQRATAANISMEDGRSCLG
ncbi:hypothetical protein [Aeromonas caviae]|uniref:hypothetical protein n=1 Tax=Aeromonas caviae TaxID=648 RepID=UPI0039F5BEC0